jgi:isoleucyl-tRNA synthetase
MEAVREVVALGRSLRVSQSIRVRQPLARLTVVSHDATVRAALEAHADLVADELNVREVVTSSDEASLARIGAKPNYRTLGPRFGPRMAEIAAAIGSLGADDLAGLLASGSAVVAGESITIGDIVVIRDPLPGVAVASGDRLSVALDTEITPELAVEGLARELVKVIQGVRKDRGFDVSDRITVRWSSTSPAVSEAFERHGSWIASEVLAASLDRSGNAAGSPHDVAGEPVTIELARV